jgi:hypothetical protein
MKHPLYCGNTVVAIAAFLPSDVFLTSTCTAFARELSRRRVRMDVALQACCNLKSFIWLFSADPQSWNSATHVLTAEQLALSVAVDSGTHARKQSLHVLELLLEQKLASLTDVVHWCIVHGRLCVLQHINAKHTRCQTVAFAVHVATDGASRGYMHLVQWAHSLPQSQQQWPADVWDAAASHAHIKVRVPFVCCMRVCMRTSVDECACDCKYAVLTLTMCAHMFFAP